jgi:hypothetical protein
MSYCNQELKIHGILYHKTASDLPSTNGKAGFKLLSKKIGVLVILNSNKKNCTKL